MKSLNEAIAKANKMSGGNYPETVYVVYSPNEEDIEGNNYHVAYEHDIDTFYCNDEILYSSDEY